MKKLIWLIDTAKWASEPGLYENFDGYFTFGPYRGVVDGVPVSYFDEPEIQPDAYWDAAPVDFVDYADIYGAKKFFGYFPLGGTATGFLSYPVFNPGWWYKPWEWLFKFPYRVNWFLKNTRGKVYGGIQVSRGWSKDTIVPKPWMTRYTAWVWRLLAGKRLYAYAFWSWDAFEGLEKHPELIRTINKLGE